MSKDDETVYYISIPNWDRFQHYKDRNPPWIKNHLELLHKDEYRNLSMHQRGVLHGIWMAYAAGHRQLRGTTLTLSRQLGNKVLKRDLESLNHAGFIELLASNLLAIRASRATRARARANALAREGSKEPSKNARARELASGSHPRAQEKNEPPVPPPCPECGVGGGHHVSDCPQLLTANLNPSQPADDEDDW